MSDTNGKKNESVSDKARRQLSRMIARVSENMEPHFHEHTEQHPDIPPDATGLGIVYLGAAMFGYWSYMMVVKATGVPPTPDQVTEMGHLLRQAAMPQMVAGLEEAERQIISRVAQDGNQVETLNSGKFILPSTDTEQ